MTLLMSGTSNFHTAAKFPSCFKLNLTKFPAPFAKLQKPRSLFCPLKLDSIFHPRIPCLKSINPMSCTNLSVLAVMPCTSVKPPFITRLGSISTLIRARDLVQFTSTWENTLAVQVIAVKLVMILHSESSMKLALSTLSA